MNKTFSLLLLFFMSFLYVGAKDKQKTTLNCQIFDYKGNTIYFDCIQTPFIKAEFPNNPGENCNYSFETDKIVTLIVNGRERFIMQPGDSIHAIIRYGENGRPQNVELAGTEQAVIQNNLARDLKLIQNNMRYKTQLLACIALDTKPVDRMKDSYTYLEKANRLIDRTSASCSPEFLNYIKAQIESLVYGSLIAYPPLYADTRRVPIDKQGIGDYWNIIKDYKLRDDIASLRCMEYSEFLMQYCFFQQSKKAHLAQKTYSRPNSLEGIYKELTSFYKGNQLDATLFLLISNYIRNGKEIEKVEPILKEYQEKYNSNKEYVEILNSLMQ